MWNVCGPPPRCAVRWVLRNFLVHQRLGQCRRILLVVAQFSEANNVNYDIFLKLHAEFKCQLGRQHNGFGIIAVNV
jgi:hypothetical protein